MYRKIIKKSRYQIPRNRYENVGIVTSILDCNGTRLTTGDKIQLINNPYETGVFLFNTTYNCFGLFRGCWYNDKNEFDPRCYGKFIPIPKDNGMRMNIKIVRSFL